jgi:hypothetical protein
LVVALGEQGDTPNPQFPQTDLVTKLYQAYVARYRLNEIDRGRFSFFLGFPLNQKIIYSERV